MAASRRVWKTEAPSDLDMKALMAYLILTTLKPTQQKGQRWKGYYSHSTEGETEAQNYARINY